MRPFRPLPFLHYPASRHSNLIASVCMSCHRFVAAGDLKVLGSIERQHVCDKKAPARNAPHFVERHRA